MADQGDFTGDPEIDVPRFKRYMDQRDREDSRSKEMTAAAYRSLPPVTSGQSVLHSTGFQPIEASKALKTYEDGAGGPACHCTLGELQDIWRNGTHPDGVSVISVGEQFPTTIPDGYTQTRGCLRFAKVDGAQVTELNGTISAPAQAVMVGAHVDGCYAVEFFGYKRTHGGGRGGGGAAGRDFHGSSDDFKVYRLVCPH